MTARFRGLWRQLSFAQQGIISARLRQPLPYNENLYVCLQSIKIADDASGVPKCQNDKQIRSSTKAKMIENSTNWLCSDLEAMKLEDCINSSILCDVEKEPSLQVHLPGSRIVSIDISNPQPKEEPLDPVTTRLEIRDPFLQVDVLEPPQVEDRAMWLTRNMLKIRRKKMNKHKLRKRRRRDEAKRRSIFMIRNKKRAKKRAAIKKKLIEKIRRILADNPKSEYPNRPYVIHRLQNW